LNYDLDDHVIIHPFLNQFIYHFIEEIFAFLIYFYNNFYHRYHFIYFFFIFVKILNIMNLLINAVNDHLYLNLLIYVILLELNYFLFIVFLYDLKEFENYLFLVLLICIFIM